MSALALEIVGDVPAGLDVRPLEVTFTALAASLETAPAGVMNLSFIDDAAMRTLNREQAGNDYATDVLSFSYIEDGEPIGDVIGEIAISYETAERQAKEAKTSLAEEVALLGLHGALHVLGYDHQTAQERETMQELQRSLLEAGNYHYREFVWQD